MTWDVQGTKRRIHAAAVTEFAELGPDGTTIDRIARRAEVNRERIYNYFGKKDELFAAVVQTELDKIAASAPLDIAGPADLGEFAGQTFDYQQSHPYLARLVLWEGLRDSDATVDDAARTQLYAGKAAAIAAAQAAGLIDDGVDAGHMVFLLISLSSYWLAAPQIARMLSGQTTDVGALHATRRAAVVLAATRLATAGPSAPARTSAAAV